MNELHFPAQNPIYISKAMTKSEFASMIGISRRTLYTWIQTIQQLHPELERTKNSRILSPATIKLLAEHFCL